MSNIVRLFRHDVRQVSRSTIALIVLFGVVVIPSFFGWFNVLSSWNPFGNVKNLRVAVANADEGYQGDLLPIRINVGEQVLSALRANSDMDWVITSEEEAIRGTQSEEYYAALVLPADFSHQMMTFLVPGATSAELDYYINQKTNALSPVIAGEAATDVSVEINQTFTKTLNEIGATLVSALADNLDDPETQSALSQVQSNATAFASQLRAGAGTARTFGVLLESSSSVLESSSQLVAASEEALHGTSGAIGEGDDSARELRTGLDGAAGSLRAAFSSSADSYRVLADRVDALYASMDGQGEAAAAALTAIAGRVDAQIAAYQGLDDTLRAQAEATPDPMLQAALELVASRVEGASTRQEALRDRIVDAADGLTQGEADGQATRDEVMALIDEAQGAVEDLRREYSEDLAPRLEELSSTLSGITGGLAVIGDDLADVGSALSSGEAPLVETLAVAQDTMSTIESDLETAAQGFDDVAATLGGAAESGDLGAIENMIGSNAATFASEVTTPVGIKTIPVFEVDTFGAQMAPFYTVLGLWVGALLLSVVIRVDVERATLPFGGSLTLTQEYLGRYGIFAALAFLQSSLLYVGLIGFVGVRPVYPGLLILAGWVMSLVFSLMTYTLVVSFGEAGKAVGVLLLVVQISAGGGAYPLAVLPQWFQSLSPFVPVSHATNAIRSAIAGIYEGDYWISLGVLALFIVPTLLLGLLFRIPLIGFNEDLSESLASTRLM
ncbi:YhgE/Pip domain-containing protein [Isoptericola halotolerans]|uniref:YhgE/Pip domain-containing protein n=1 Tax=Isoptericola halotolerans TaxID=300560 RepID=UPI00388E80A0